VNHRTIHRRAHRFGALLIAGLMLAVSAAACTPDGDRSNAVLLVNTERSAVGMPGVSWDDELGLKAQAWAQHLAEIGQLGHSVLTDGVSADWTALGENVGEGADLGAIHDAFMKSPSHRAAILNPRFRAVGVGAVLSNDVIFVVEVFRG
jgi:uncharacterized protein YkwD